jgi:hypothetical protein
MLDLMDVLKLMANGQKLPQEKYPAPSDATIEALQEAEPNLLNSMFEKMEQDGDPVDTLLEGLRELTSEHGWFATTTVLSMCFAHRYTQATIPELSSVTPETLGLLRMLPIAVEQGARDSGAWTVPIAILTDLGEEDALSFTACAGLCAGVGYLQSTVEDRAEGES